MKECAGREDQGIAAFEADTLPTELPCPVNTAPMIELQLLWLRINVVVPVVIPHHFKKSAGYCVIPSVQKFAFECPSVSASFLLSILSIF